MIITPNNEVQKMQQMYRQKIKFLSDLIMVTKKYQHYKSKNNNNNKKKFLDQEFDLEKNLTKNFEQAHNLQLD